MRIALTFLIAVLGATSLTSCVSIKEFERKLEHKNEAYENRQFQRKLRQDARDDRYEAWFDRVMN